MTSHVEVAFDVDGTLFTPDGNVNEAARSLLVLLAGCPNVTVRVWSGSGALHAQMAVRLLGIGDYVAEASSKTEPNQQAPDITFDDQAVTLGTVNIIMSGGSDDR